LVSKEGKKKTGGLKGGGESLKPKRGKKIKKEKRISEECGNLKNLYGKGWERESRGRRAKAIVLER